MHDILNTFTLADYTFLVGILEGPVGFTDDRLLHTLLADLEREDTEETRKALNHRIERELRYLGSADLAYAVRFMIGKDPGVPFNEIVRDVAKQLKVEVSPLGTEREVAEDLVERYATQQFASFTPERQQELLESLGVEEDRAAEFIKKSAGVFVVPVLIKAFGIVVVDGLIKTVIFGTIARIIGRQLANRLFTSMVARFPWWLSWIGPVSWSLSIGWTVLDLQGPAYRKTVPAVLYLGLCSLRDRNDGVQDVDWEEV